MTHEEPAGYAEASEELEEILATLDGDDIDVDRLADHVARAAELIEFCRSRIDSARVNVERIVADFERAEPGPDPDEAT